MKNRTPSAVACALGLALLAGCATGPAFVAPQPAALESVVVLYRPFALHGAAVTRRVQFGGLPAGELRNASYLNLIYRGKGAALGLAVSGCKPSLELLMMPGRITYVRAETVPTMLMLGGKAYADHRCVLDTRDAAEAMVEASGLRRSQ